MDKEKILQIKNLSLSFCRDEGKINVIDDLSMDLYKDEILAIVGKSGCGKTMLCKSILALLPKSGVIEKGQIIFDAMDILTLKSSEIEKIRGDKIGLVFQNPMSSLNPALKIGVQIREGAILHNRNLSKEQATKDAISLMELVGIDDSAARFNQYPYELSGGLCQRAAIAMALSPKPTIFIADEITTSLDTVNKELILALLKSIQKQTGITVIFITHDISILDGFADRTLVMEGGRLI